MKTFRYIALSLPLVFLCCIEDNSKYGGIELNEITIEGIGKSYEIELGGRLHITPTITASSGDISGLSYAWVKYNSTQLYPDTLSKEKDLDVVIDDVLPGVPNTLSLKITDEETGVFTLFVSSLTTVGVYSGGTLMLCRTGSEYDLFLLKKDGTTLYENIYALVNDGEKLPVSSTRLFLADGNVRNTAVYKAVIVASNDADGGVYIDPVLFSKKSTMRERFFFSDDLPPTLDITGYANGQSEDYLVINGLVYSRINDNDQGLWYPPLSIAGEPTDYFAAPWCAQYSDYPYYGKPVYHDNIHGRMMINTSGGTFSFFRGANHEFDQFDPNDLGAGVEMVMCGNMNNSPNEVWALMKDPADGYFLITYQMRFNNDWTADFVTKSRTPLPEASYPALYSMTAFVPGTKQKVDTFTPWQIYSFGQFDVFFFVSDNKVYAFNVNTVAYGMLIDGAAQNYNITGVDCTNVPNYTDDDPDGTINQLTLAVKDINIGSKSGGIAVYSLSLIGGVTATKLYEMTGFCDEVISTMEKMD